MPVVGYDAEAARTMLDHGMGVAEVAHVLGRREGWQRIQDTWAQDRNTGIQGLTSVRYEEPDDDTLAYVEWRAAAAAGLTNMSLADYLRDRMVG